MHNRFELMLPQDSTRKQQQQQKIFIYKFPENSEHASFSFLYDYLRIVGRQL